MNAPTAECSILPSPQGQGEAYLRLQLDAQNLILIPMQQARQVLQTPAEKLSAIPNMPACILGLLNQRSRVIWVADLPQMLGLEPLDLDAQSYSVAVVQVGSLVLGLAVNAVTGVVRSESPIAPIAEGSAIAKLTPYLLGTLEQEETFLVLDGRAVLHSPLLQSATSLGAAVVYR
jgi:positive phototaxis protein PixI